MAIASPPVARDPVAPGVARDAWAPAAPAARDFSRTALAAAVAVALACCGVPLSREARYVGAVTPEGACGVAGRGTLTVAGDHWAFTPSDGVILLRGEVGPDGALAGSLATSGADRKPFVMALSARISGDQVSGAYTTPRCRFAVALTRA